MLKTFDNFRHLRENKKVITRKSYPANSNIVSTLPRSGEHIGIKSPYKISYKKTYK